MGFQAFLRSREAQSKVLHAFNDELQTSLWTLKMLYYSNYLYIISVLYHYLSFHFGIFLKKV